MSFRYFFWSDNVKCLELTWPKTAGPLLAVKKKNEIFSALSQYFSLLRKFYYETNELLHFCRESERSPSNRVLFALFRFHGDFFLTRHSGGTRFE